jgi:signal transduction histidine kinase/ActR/RegA family two-component response regulator
MAAVRAAVGPVAGDDIPLMPFVLSVTVSAWCGGMKPGLVATALGALAGVYLFFPPAGELWIGAPAEKLRLFTFLAEGLVISALCEALLSAHERAEMHARDATEKKRQLEAKDRHKNEFLATLAHEVRNPLATIRTALAVAKRHGSDQASLRRSQEIIDRQVTLVSRLLGDLSDLTSISQGKLRLQMDTFDMGEVANRAVESSRHVIDSHTHRLDVLLPGRRLPVRGDITRLTQIVLNLLTNSAKYTPPGGHIRLTVDAEGEEAVVRVRDNGVGIPPESLPKVFELGEQVERNLDRSEGGLGIGLAVVRRLVDMHGGSVTALSDGPGHGCEFVVRLPLLPEETPSPDPGRDRPRPILAAPTYRRILVVDDEPTIAEYLAKSFRARGFQVEVAADGHSALNTVSQFRPDVVVLDIGIPEISGYEVARRISQQPWSRHAVLIALTGWDRDEDVVRMKEAGFHHHVVKPAHAEDVLHLLDERYDVPAQVD